MLLTRAWEAYAKGEPFLTDDEFDALAINYDYNTFTEGVLSKKARHAFPMYSLKKVFDEEPDPLPEGSEAITSPKLDGAAISLMYQNGILVQASTRGDGEIGEDITDKAYHIDTIPKTYVDTDNPVQIVGEVVCSKELENARNFVSGALHTKSIKEFKEKKAIHLIFIAYGLEPYIHKTYKWDMEALEKLGGFLTILDGDYCKAFFRTDGMVTRIDNNEEYYALGYTSKHPRGAFARKLSSDVEVKEAKLKEVIWQVGRTGKVTPVAVFEDIVIDDAVINRATLHNAGFLEGLELDTEDTLLITRSGGIIPKVMGKI